MERSQQPDLRLEPWSDEGGLALLTGLNTPEMTEHLGGPETPDKLADRHLRYLRLGGPDGPFGRMFRITLGGETAGVIGYWETTWQGETVWETGWGVLPEFQGRGVAAGAARLVAGEARAAGRHAYLHAFPATGHAASNGVCRRAGFTLRGASTVEYPKGNWHPCNDWRLALSTG
ncbi:GNAT family N-acetyltransferase [Streptomyces sp. WAC 01529]|uniref:GNAT family N-acetyltransferase n=1 Tax=Streptomyces sp. WAC 01529 TaxID=2203205 RepID=UPI000F6DFB2A|nr:GNAT family N-acetyltransferase [Streptomyces sp. WAC 01529]AZM54743.1 GNAT family N-acetyltransferase [Streptomyces sp. WAC 01529]